MSRGEADFVSLARPFLADPEFVKKAKEGRGLEINTCIACNQACLDHVFKQKRATCLVNPQACYETELTFQPAHPKKKILVVGGGPAGLAFANYAADRGHDLTLMEKEVRLGGQFLLAKDIPGKHEFAETIRYFEQALAKKKVRIELGTSITPSSIDWQAYDEVVLATGVYPRKPDIKGIEHPKVLSYLDVLKKKVPVVGELLSWSRRHWL